MAYLTIVATFKAWLEEQSGQPFPADAFLNGNLEMVAEEMRSTTINGRRLLQTISQDEAHRQLLRRWIKRCALLLELVRPGGRVSLTMGSVPVPDDPQHQQHLLSQLRQLGGLCEDAPGQEE